MEVVSFEQFNILLARIRVAKTKKELDTLGTDILALHSADFRTLMLSQALNAQSVELRLSRLERILLNK